MIALTRSLTSGGAPARRTVTAASRLAGPRRGGHLGLPGAAESGSIIDKRRRVGAEDCRRGRGRSAGMLGAAESSRTARRRAPLYLSRGPRGPAQHAGFRIARIRLSVSVRRLHGLPATHPRRRVSALYPIGEKASCVCVRACV
jgi:hypothetical protein